jgi:hypothetical protein
MTELHILRCYWMALRSRITDDQRGISTLEAILLTAGFGILALATLVLVTGKVNQAVSNIPTGP